MITYLPPVGLEERILEAMDRMAGFAFLEEARGREEYEYWTGVYVLGRAAGIRADVADLRGTLATWRAEDTATTRIRRLIEEVS